MKQANELTDLEVCEGAVSAALAVAARMSASNPHDDDLANLCNDLLGVIRVLREMRAAAHAKT